MRIAHVVASALVVSRFPDTPCVWNCILTIGGVCVVRERVIVEAERLFANLTTDDLWE